MPWTIAATGFSGLAFAMKNVAQLLLMCDQRDIGLSVNAGDEVTPDAVAGQDAPRIFVYDAYPGGIGFSAPLYGMHDELLARTRALIQGCDCENGCPTCVGPIGQTGPLAKTVALRLLQHLVRPTLTADTGETLTAGDEPVASLPSVAAEDDVPF